MTYVLNLEPQTARRIEERAAQSAVTPEAVIEELIESALKTSRSERLGELTNEVFEERAGAYEVLASGSSHRYATDEEFEAAKNRVFDRYEKTFEILAEGAK
jgi:hypothetical protein